MRFSSAPVRRSTRVLIGVGLVAWLWLLASVVAFVPFDRDTPAEWIVGTTLATFLLTVAMLVWRRRADWETGVYSLLTIAALVGLYHVPLRDDLSDEMLAVVERTSQRHQDRHAFARYLFWDTALAFTGPSREYLLQPQRIFVLKSATYYWETRGYMPSHLLTQLYRHMLIASERFSPDEVRYRTGRCFNSPHGYLEIEHPTQILRADLWAAQNFDDYRFGQVVDMPSCEGLMVDPEPKGPGL